MGRPKYPLIALSEIDKEAREIAVAWVEQYGNIGFDIQNKQKLASDIMNYHRYKMEDGEEEGYNTLWLEIIHKIEKDNSACEGYCDIIKWLHERFAVFRK